MMERVAAGPVDQPNIGVGVGAAVVRELLAGRQQQVGDARDGDEVANGVRSLREMRQADSRTRGSDITHRAVPVTETSTRQPDLAEQCRQCKSRPHRLLAVRDSLQRPRDGDERADRRHAARQLPDVVCGNLALRTGPLRILGDAVGSSEHIRLEGVGASCVPLEELAIGQAFDQQRVRQTEHQRHIGSRDDRIPGVWQTGREIVAEWTDERELDSVGHRLLEVRARVMFGHPAVVHEHVLGGDAAEGNDETGVLDDGRPRRRPAQHFLRAADDVRQDDDRCAVAVRVDRARVAADEVQQPLQLRL